MAKISTTTEDKVKLKVDDIGIVRFNAFNAKKVRACKERSDELRRQTPVRDIAFNAKYLPLCDSLRSSQVKIEAEEDVKTLIVSTGPDTKVEITAAKDTTIKFDSENPNIKIQASKGIFVDYSNKANKNASAKKVKSKAKKAKNNANKANIKGSVKAKPKPKVRMCKKRNDELNVEGMFVWHRRSTRNV